MANSSPADLVFEGHSQGFPTYTQNFYFLWSICNVTVLLNCNAAAVYGGTVPADLILWPHLVMPTQSPFPAIFRTAPGSLVSDLDPNRAVSDTYPT